MAEDSATGSADDVTYGEDAEHAADSRRGERTTQYAAGPNPGVRGVCCGICVANVGSRRDWSKTR